MVLVPEIEGLYRLKEICHRPVNDPDEIHDRFVCDLFPMLDMERWIEEIHSSVPENMVTTFGTIASALGTERASRTVGSVCSAKGLHRVVYSDGRVPPSSVKELDGEVKLKRRGDDLFASEDLIIRNLELRDPPFESLAQDQMIISQLLRKGKRSISSLAGIDISSGGGRHHCAVCSHEENGDPVDSICVEGSCGIPYVSGFLFYREAPLVMPSIRKAEERGLIDDGTLILMDGNGRLHPRRMGIACQIGAVTSHMTCGVAKKLMLGTVGEYSRVNNREEIAPVMHANERIGTASRRNGGSPVYISSGHMTELEDVEKRVIAAKRFRLPEPTRYAHREANRCRRSSESPSGDL